MNKDLEHLKLLSIFHYIGAGVALLFAVFYGFQFLAEFREAKNILIKNDNVGGIDKLQLLMSIVFGIYLLVEVLRMAGMIVVGKLIQLRRYRLFCIIFSGINCAFFPVGTALGVFTIVILMRDSIKQLYFEKIHANIPQGGLR